MSRVVVTGAAGLLGRALVDVFGASGDEVVGLTHREIDLTDPDSLELITAARPKFVVNAAAWTDVDGCAHDPERAMRINGVGAGLVAEAAGRAGAAMIYVSTNEVFDGGRFEPYDETDEPNPINPYGASKLAGERAVAAATEQHLVIRTAWLFGPDRGFPERIRAAAARAIDIDEPLRVVDDEWGNPTPIAELASSILAASRLFRSRDHPHVLHLAGEPPTTRFAWARQILIDLPIRIKGISQAEYLRASRVPPRAVLATDRARRLGLPTISWQAVPSGSAR